MLTPSTALEQRDRLGIAHCGAGITQDQARQPVMLSVGDVRVGFLSCVQRYDMYEGWLYADGTRGGCNRLGKRTVTEDLPQLKQATDLSIVLVHSGRNYRDVALRLDLPPGG